MGFSFRKAFLLTRKELKESFRSKEVILIVTILPLTFAVLMPLSIPLINRFTPNTGFSEDEFENFPPLVSFWDELNSKEKFLILYNMIFFETFLLLPMILPMTIAADTIAGERERKTIEALISTPLTSGELLFGKLLTTMIPTILITWISGFIFMLISDLSLYKTLGRLVFPNLVSLVLIFGFSPFISLITTQTMIIVSTKAKGMRSAQQIGSLVVIPLFSFILGETALLILANPYWTLLSSVFIIICTLILLRINMRLFDREHMIAISRG